ncbi:hypothetical protein KR093_001593 [Drosophila rubida]|uniref:Uncharacterized protein n=1 Tax=Drosophila rubida TaxID=30044 RepID=A0AAD4KAD8_9MUSC|nr:hypothetical protein KR093_001593 [Drosophila rubida]
MSQHHHHRWPHSNSTANHADADADDGDEPFDPLANLLSLQLHKPAHWNWELSTSRSCSNIALPRILLYDHTGSLLLDADGASEQTYRPRASSNSSSTTPQQQQQQHRRRKRAATANLAQSLQQAASQLPSELPGELHGLRIGEATPSCRSPASSQAASSGRHCIDFSTHELPDWRPRQAASASAAASSSHGSSRSIRFEDELAYPTPPSTSTLTTPANSWSGGPREKRRYRRSQSSGQRSILERFSMSRGRHSSPEYAQELTLEQAPRYFLRTSKAGTLVIKDESFSRVRQRRRRHKHSSSDNLLQPPPQSASEGGVPVTSPQRLQPQRGREPLLSTSEEEERQSQSQSQSQSRQPRSRRTQRNGCKDVAAADLISVDPDNCVYRASSGATAR